MGKGLEHRQPVKPHTLKDLNNRIESDVTMFPVKPYNPVGDLNNRIEREKSRLFSEPRASFFQDLNNRIESHRQYRHGFKLRRNGSKQ